MAQSRCGDPPFARASYGHANQAVSVTDSVAEGSSRRLPERRMRLEPPLLIEVGLSWATYLHSLPSPPSSAHTHLPSSPRERRPGRRLRRRCRPAAATTRSEHVDGEHVAGGCPVRKPAQSAQRPSRGLLPKTVVLRNEGSRSSRPNRQPQFAAPRTPPRRRARPPPGRNRAQP